MIMHPSRDIVTDPHDKLTIAHLVQLCLIGASMWIAPLTVVFCWGRVS